MQLGLFTMPSHPPECSLYDGHEWDLQTLRWADELGFSEAWIGEHHVAPWEPHPSPDLLIAQSLKETTTIRLGPGGFLLPYHHPAELANRVAMLDHMAQGRLNFGVAASGLLVAGYAPGPGSHARSRPVLLEVQQVRHHGSHAAQGGPPLGPAGGNPAAGRHEESQAGVFHRGADSVVRHHDEDIVLVERVVGRSEAGIDVAVELE